MKRRVRWRPLRIGVGSIALAALLFPVFSNTPSSAVSSNAYLDDFSAASGMIATESGNFSSGCGFNWSAQSVLDTDLLNPSLNGFLESVTPTSGASVAGSGHLTIQHWFAGGDQLAWRIPIALDQIVGAAQIKLVFDDPDWTVNPTSLQQFSDWTAQPGYESAFHRFTGITGYAPHDDSQVLPVTWGIDGAGHQTLTLSLGMIEANTSTVIGFTGTAISTPSMTGAQNIAAGVAYGTKLTVAGMRPLVECHQVAYGISEAQSGETVAVEPVVTDANGDANAAVPLGTAFSLSAGGHDGFQIDATTGVISWTVPEDHEDGIVDVSVTVTYPDHNAFATGSQSSTSVLFGVTARSHATLPPVPNGAPPIPPTLTPQEVDIREDTRSFTDVVPQKRDVERSGPSLQGQAARLLAPIDTQSAYMSAPIITLEAWGSPLLPILYVILGGLILGSAAALLLRQTRTGKRVSARYTSGETRIG